MRRLWMQFGLATLCGLFATTVRADEQPIDTVILFDVSVEMSSADKFNATRALLGELIPLIARPGAQVALIPFGDGAHKPTVVHVPSGAEAAAEARSRLHKVVAEARAEDPHRYLYGAIERGLEQLREFKERYPRRERRLVVLSLGERQVPDSESKLSLPERIARHDGPGMAIGRDWTLWYGYYRGGDAALRGLIDDRGVGTAIALDGLADRRWGKVHVDWPVIELGSSRLGEWSRTVTFEATGPVGTVLKLRAGVGPSANGASVTVTPASVTLASERQRFTATLSGFAREGSNYHGAWMRADAAGSRPLWIGAARVPLLSGKSRATVRFEQTRVEFERVDRGTKVTRTFRLIANEEARQRRCELRFEAADVPPDVLLQVEPALVRLDETDRVKIVLSAYRASKPGAFVSRLVLTPSEDLSVEKREIAVEYQVERGGVRVLESRLVVPALVRGGDVIAKLTLAPDEGAIEAGALITARVGELPAGLEVDVPRRFALHGETELQVRLRSPAGTPDGVLRTTLHLSAPGEIQVVPSVIPIEVHIVAPPPVAIVERVEAGRRYETQAAAVAVEIPLEVGRVHHGTLLEFVPASKGYLVEPDRARLVEGAQKIRIEVKPERVDPGPASVSLRVYSIRAGERRLAGECVVAWTVAPSFLRIVDWRPPPALTVGANLVTAKLEFEASPDLKGRDLDVVSNFGSLPHDAHFAAGFDSVRIQGGSQTVTLPIDIVRSTPGKFPGTVALEIHDAAVDTAELRPLPFTIEIPEAPLGAELLDPAKQRKLIYLAGSLVLLFMVFALFFRHIHRRTRRRVEFMAPPRSNEPDPAAFREYEFWSAYQDEKF